MRRQKSELERAVGEAVRALSKGHTIPKKNRLLQSPLVTQYLHEYEIEDAPEHRHLAVEALLKRFVNEYGLEEPSKRRREAHERTFNFLYAALRGQGKPPDISERIRSYDRYRPAGFRMLAEKFEQQEQQVTHSNDEDDSGALELARTRAQEIVQYLQEHPDEIDLFALDDLTDAAAYIEIYNYYEEAERYYRAVVQRLPDTQRNKVILTRQAVAARGLAHCLMNQNDLEDAVAAFHQLTTLAAKLSDAELWTHGTHMLGVTTNMLGHWQRSLAALNQALHRMPKNDSYQYRAAWIKRDKITTLITKRDYREIDRLAQESLAYRERASNPEEPMATLEVWGRALIAQRKHGEAEARLREVQSTLDSAPSKLFHMVFLTTLTEHYIAWGKIGRGAQYAKEAQALAFKHGFWHQLQRLEQIWATAKI